MIKSGENLPLFKYKDRQAGDFVTINLQQEMKGKKVVIFGLPGAFTPTCSSQQLPGYDSLYSKFVAAGISDIYCTSVNDPFVMNSWFDALNVQILDHYLTAMATSQQALEHLYRNVTLTSAQEVGDTLW